MSYIIRNMIEYYNQNEYISPNLKYFKQITIDNHVCVPIEKQNIKQIIKAISEVKIVNTRVIKTPKGKSLEGVVLTGHKLIVEGVIIQQIQYIADTPDQPIHTSYFETPLLTFIVLPEEFNPYSFITASAFIENVTVMKENKRCIYISNTVLVAAEL